MYGPQKYLYAFSESGRAPTLDDLVLFFRNSRSSNLRPSSCLVSFSTVFIIIILEAVKPFTFKNSHVSG